MGRHVGAVETLRKRRDFLHTQREGRRFKGRHLVVLASKPRAATCRVGLTISRKVGNAVIRNRVRRRLREIVRLHATLPNWHLDFVLIAYRSAADANYCNLKDDLLCLLNRAHKWDSQHDSYSR